MKKSFILFFLVFLFRLKKKSKECTMKKLFIEQLRENMGQLNLSREHNSTVTPLHFCIFRANKLGLLDSPQICP